MSSVQKIICDFFANNELTIKSHATLWLAVSGGKDSMVLLDQMAKLWRAGELPNFESLKVVHVNHGVRGVLAKRDADFVEKRCRDYDIDFSLVNLPFTHGEHKSEAELREHRYREIEFLMNPQDFAATAHHKRDQAETILLNVLRGTGLRGLRGIAPKRGRWLRPILSASDAQIQSVAADQDLEWFEDETNQDEKFDRNWLRLNILPQLESRRPGAVERIAQLAEDARREWDHQQQDSLGADSSSPVKADKKSLPEPSVFAREPKSGVQIANVSKLTELPQSLWSEFLGFTLYRKHIEALNLVLQKGLGKVDVPKGMIWFSCGWLAWWRQEDELKQFQRVQNMGSAFESVLGTWELHKGFGVFTRREDSSTNASVKKRLQDANIPEYLRSCIPLYEYIDKGRERRVRSLIPVNWLNHEEWNLGEGELVTFSPSAFATEMFAKKRQLIGGSPDQLPNRGRAATKD